MKDEYEANFPFEYRNLKNSRYLFAINEGLVCNIMDIVDGE